MNVCLFIAFCCSLTYCLSEYYSACAIGGQYDGHLPFWLPAFVKLISLLLHILLADGEINILLPLVVSLV